MHNIEVKKRVGENIRVLREQQHLSQRKLSMMLGVQSHTYLSGVERGLKNPSLDYICGIANALGVSVDYFFTALPPEDEEGEPRDANVDGTD